MQERAGLTILLIFAVAEVFSGALRYYLSLAGFPWLLYLPKVLVAAWVLVSVLRVLISGGGSAVFVAVLVVFMTYFGVGWYFTGNPAQAMFGVFALAPLLLGVLTEKPLRRIGPRIAPYTLVLWCAAALGVLLDMRARVPWAGFQYALGGTQVSASRQWTAFGLARVGGFSRASFEVAEQLVYLAIVTLLLGRSRFSKWLMWLATGGLVLVTTTKQAVAVYVCVSAILALMLPKFVWGTAKIRTGVWTPVIVAVIGAALPVTTLFVHYQLGLNSVVSFFLLGSFQDRLIRIWPGVFHLVERHGNVLVGRGIGGIGAAQAFFEPSLYTPGDNLYLYLYATFGVPALAFLTFYVRRVSNIGRAPGRWNLVMWTLAIAVLLGGWATNGLESGYTALVLGISLAYSVRRARVAGITRRDPRDKVRGVSRGITA